MLPSKNLPAIAAAAALTAVALNAQSTAIVQSNSMATGVNGYTVSAPLLTIGETLTGTTGALNPSTTGDYTPVGVLDGMGAYRRNANTVRVFANHELLQFRGEPYSVSDGQGGSFLMTGARISYFDIDRTSREIVDAGLAYNRIYDPLGNVAQNTDFLLDGFGGFSRFCSGGLFEAASTAWSTRSTSQAKKTARTSTRSAAASGPSTSTPATSGSCRTSAVARGKT